MNTSHSQRSEIRIEAGPGEYDEHSESVSINPNTSHLEGDESQTYINESGTPERQSEEGNSELQEETPNDSTRESATEIYAWGCDSHGQMGISNKKQNRAYITPKIYSFNISLRQASSGDEHAAIVAGKVNLNSDSGHVYTMGNNSDGRLGIVEKENRKIVNVPVLVERLLDHKIIKISCGSGHTAALSDAGQVFSWGLNQFGALGLGRIIDHSLSNPSRLPYFVENGIRIVDVSCGFRHTGFVAEHGALYMCGSNEYGQLGLSARALPPNSMKVESTPKHVTNLAERIIQVACGMTHTLALTDENNVYAMGSNKHGQLGTGNKVASTLPTKVVNFEETSNLYKIAAGGHSAAISSTGQLYIWGSGIFGEYLEPCSVAREEGAFVDVSVGNNFGSAIHENGSIWTWGSNAKGELGLGDMDARILPTMIKNLKGRKAGQVSSGGAFSIAISTPSELKIRRMMGEVSQVSTNSRHLRDAISEFEHKIASSTTPKGLHSIVEDTKQESADESHVQQFSAKGMRPSHSYMRASKQTRASREMTSQSKDGQSSTSVKKAIAQAHREMNKRIQQSRSTSRSRSFNAPLQMQKHKLSTKDLAPPPTQSTVASHSFQQRRSSASGTSRLPKGKHQSTEYTSSRGGGGGGFTHRRSTTTTHQHTTHSQTYHHQPQQHHSYQEMVNTKSRQANVHATHSYSKDRSVSPALSQKTMNTYQSIQGSRSQTPNHPHLNSENQPLYDSIQSVENKYVSRQHISQASTKEPHLSAPGSGYVTPGDAVKDAAGLERERIRTKELELRTEQLRLENYKLVEGPGGVLELKRQLADKETHFEEMQNLIQQEKTELIRKLEQQTLLLGNLEKEVVVLRSSQDNYDTRFRHLDQEKERITVHTEEEIKRLQLQVEQIDKERKDLRSQLAARKEEEARRVKEFQDELNSKLETLCQKLEKEQEKREGVEEQLDRVKQLRDRQGEEIERLRSQQGQHDKKAAQLEQEIEKRHKIEQSCDKYRQLSNQQMNEIQRLQDVIRENANVSMEADSQMVQERRQREKAEEEIDKLKALQSSQLKEIEHLAKIIDSKQEEERRKNEERERRLMAQERADRLQQLSKRQVEEIDRLRSVDESLEQKDDQIEQERRKRERAEQALDKQKQLGIIQSKEIERLKVTLDMERSQLKSEMSSLREQADKNSLVNREIVERIVSEQVVETELRVRQEFENENNKLTNQVRQLNFQNQTLSQMLGGARDQANKLRIEIREWDKRAQIYESTIMGLRVQLNYMEQQNRSIPSMVSPQRQTPRSPMTQYVSSASRLNAAGQEHHHALSSDRKARNYMSENTAKAEAHEKQQQQSRSAFLDGNRSEREQQKKLEEYSLTLLKSIEKRAYRSGGGDAKVQQHLSSNPIIATLNSRFLISRSSVSSVPPPQIANRSKLPLLEKLTPQRKRGSEIVVREQNASSSTSGIQTGRFGSQRGEDEEKDVFEQAGEKALTEVEERLREGGEEEQMSQTVDFEVVRSKLENISKTSKELGIQALEHGDEIDEQAKVFSDEGPPSVGDAEPSSAQAL